MNQNTILELFRYHQDRNLTDYRGLKSAFHYDMMYINGAKLLGAGWYSTVWAVGGRVFKINSGSNGGRDGFVHWVDGIRGFESNPHLPRVGAVAVDYERYCIELEPLTPLDAADFQAMGFSGFDTTVKGLADYVRGFPDLVGAIDLAYSIVQRVNPEHDYGPNPDLFCKLSSIDFSNGSRFPNLMKRGATLVLNDPIAYSAESIEPYNIKLRQSLGLAA